MRIRTGYSFRNAVGTIKEVYDKLKEENLPLVITDRASTFGFVAWDKICRKGGNAPIFGVELGASPNIEEKKPAIDHWTFIAKDTLTPINELVELATSQFRYEPLLRYWQALEAPVYKIIGHRTVVDDLPPNTDPDCFFGLSPSITMGQVRRFLEKGYRPIACSDNKYPSIGDRAFHEVICGRNASSQTYPQHIMGREELIDELMEKRGMSGDLVSEAFENWDKITCTATMHTGELPHLEWPSTIREQCIAGAEKFNIDLTDPVYHERLERELKLIDDKNFTDYFQIVGDAVRYARGVMVVGPARGCFLPGQVVDTRGSNSKKTSTEIQNIEVDQKIESGFGGIQQVIDKFEYDVDEEIVCLEFSDGSTLQCTKDHKILTHRGWVAADSLDDDDVICTMTDGKRQQLVKMRQHGWPLHLAHKSIDVGLEFDDVQCLDIEGLQGSKKLVWVNCTVCGAKKQVSLLKLFGRTSDIRGKEICSDCANGAASRTDRARSNNSIAQKAAQGNLECRIKNATSVSRSRGRVNKDLSFNFPGYKDMIKKAYGGCCADCKDNSHRLDIHHIDMNRQNNDITNLILLCANCHTRYHNYQRYQAGKALIIKEHYKAEARKVGESYEAVKIKELYELLRESVRSIS